MRTFLATLINYITKNILLSIHYLDKAMRAKIRYINVYLLLFWASSRFSLTSYHTAEYTPCVYTFVGDCVCVRVFKLEILLLALH